MKLNKLFSMGDNRTLNVKKNIFLSMIVKGLSIIVSLLIVPITLDYLAEEEYGIWLTLSSMLAWIAFFDIGLTNGLRNKLTEALSIGDMRRAKIYISTTLLLLTVIVSLLLFLFAISFCFIDWQIVFNTKLVSSDYLGKIVFATVVCFGLQFILKIIIALLFAVQKAALADLIGFIGQFLALVTIWIFTKITNSGSLYWVAITYSVLPVFVLLFSYIYIFYFRFKNMRPSLRCVDLIYTKDLLGLGVNFFIVQASALILFSTSNFIIAQIIGPSEVTIYNIAFKYFSIVTIGFTIILTPLWNAYTESYAKGDYLWIKKTLHKTQLFWCVSVLGIFLMLLCSDYVYTIWIGKEVASQIPFSLSLACSLYILISTWNNLTAILLNGLGKIRMQMIWSTINIFAYIPMALWLGNLFGIKGILYALCISLLPGAIIQPIQCNKIINQTARGLWNK